MKKNGLIILCLLLAGCTQKKRVDDLAFKFCDKVSSDKAEYLKCFTDIVECYSKSSNKFDSDMKFIECARLFQVKVPTAVPFKYTPTLDETDIDAEVWREIENLENIDPRKNKKQKVEDRSEPAPEIKAAEKKEPPKAEAKAEPKVSEKQTEKSIEKKVELPPVLPEVKKTEFDF